MSLIIYADFLSFDGSFVKYTTQVDNVDLPDINYTWVEIDIETWNLEFVQNWLLPELNSETQIITWIPRI